MIASITVITLLLSALERVPLQAIFDPSRERTGAYRRRKEREDFVAGELNKLSLFEVE